jgi:hypothetical protein
VRPEIQRQVEDIRLVAATLDPDTGGAAARRRRFTALRAQFTEDVVPSRQHLSRLMDRFAPGLFVGGNAADVPWDNLDLERWFRLPKGHERRIHGHRHAGVRLVVEGPTLLLALDAHRNHEAPFTAEELHPYRYHPAPPDQEAARQRRRIMRRARSPKKRQGLLQELEQRYLDGG